ncbi:MAG: hypothetical protein HC915_15980 [Anaerolineae bacterium]|nr:hypothetical protein [Anaerolineae bacterium]
MGLAQRQATAWALTGALLVAAALLYTDIRQRPDGAFHVVFLDVGHHNAILLQSPGGGTVLIDGGRFPTRLLDGLGDYLPARQRHLDLLILTQTEGDDLAALPELAQRYRIGAVITPPNESLAPDYLALLDQLQSANVPVQAVYAGYQITLSDGVVLEALHPASLHVASNSPGEDAPSPNLVWRVQYDQAVFLLMGESNAPAEAILLQHPHQVQATVLQVAQHGSGEANSARFLEAVAPQAAVLQVDAANTLGHPAPGVVGRLQATRLFRTDQHGTIRFSTDGERLWITTTR